MSSGKAVTVETDLAVRRLIARYSHLIDDGNAAGVAELFTAEGKVIIGETQHAGREGIVAWLANSGGGGQHQVTNVAVSNGSAEGTFHALSDLAFLRRDGDAWATRAVGRYHDTIVEDGGALRFTQRIITVR
jgi:hypothetical protein